MNKEDGVICLVKMKNLVVLVNKIQVIIQLMMMDMMNILLMNTVIIQTVMYKVKQEIMKVKILMMFLIGVKKIQIEFAHY